MTDHEREISIIFPAAVQQRLDTQWDQFQQKVADDNWVSEKLSPHKEELFRVWGFSEFAAGQCVRQPGLLLDLINSNDLFRRYPDGFYASALRHRMAQFDSEKELFQCLRQFRNREMLRIAWRDLCGHTDLIQTMADLSGLADACLAETLHYLHHKLVAELGQPQDKQGRSQRMLVLAMGKLGAHELNYSSDIDLIFAYPEPGETQGTSRSISNEEFFIRLSKQLITALDARTEDGFVFRVDMRLRPFGDSGPLCISLDALENYYQSHGREWERYAFIKARVVSGDPDPSNELVSMLRPFVYRRYLDYGVYESLREMKQLIVTEVKRKKLKDNIKLGAGGIREIEFIGQVFQLIRGGRNHELQQKQILHTLDLLSERRLLPQYVVDELKTAYIFLRTSEHRLQQLRDAQTHVLPINEDERLLLALSMGFNDWKSYLQQLEFHRQRVHGHFNQVFESPQISQSGEEDISIQLKQLWMQKIDEDSAKKLLASSGYQDSEEAFRQIKAFASSSKLKALSKTGRQRLDGLMPLIIAAVAPSPDAHQVLGRIIELIQSISRRSSYLSLLLENPMALSQLVRLCSSSSWIAHQLTRHPLLLDELLDPRTLYQPPNKEQLAADMANRIAPVASDDLEQQMDVLRHFKQANVLRVAAADISGAVPLMIVSDHLTYIAETVVTAALDMAWQHMVTRHGLPGGFSDDSQSTHFSIIAYGKMGGIELSYGSDLDLVFLYDADPNSMTNGPKAVANSVFYARLGQRLIHILTAFTPAGNLYDVDMRLRPSGESGLLVTSIDTYREYQANKAWTWEHQALVRARPVAGDQEVIAEFEQVRQEILARPREIEQLKQDVVDMRERMRKELVRSEPGFFDLKQGEGGITDIEFMVQYMVLASAASYNGLTTYSDNIRILDSIAENGLMEKLECDELADTYRAFRRDIHKFALKELPAIVPETAVEQKKQRVCEIWKKYMLAH
ncbi:bifunctional [glutamate--ammonia ligase]-adenylyl-L-tyrosine phosphorylase/[glutamate--ammonia-ligase] adenylyltransferase [Kaarinaea lacus]